MEIEIKFKDWSKERLKKAGKLRQAGQNRMARKGTHLL